MSNQSLFILHSKELSQSNNGCISSLRDEKGEAWLGQILSDENLYSDFDPVKKTAASVLFSDGLRNIYFEGELFTDSDEYDSISETYTTAQAFVDFVKRVLFQNNESEFNDQYPKLLQQWHQTLFGLGKTIINSAVIDQNLAAEVDYVTNIRRPQKKITVETLAFNIRLKNSSAKAKFDTKHQIPGFIKTIFALEEPGFKLTLVDPSNSLLRKICMDEKINRIASEKTNNSSKNISSLKFKGFQDEVNKILNNSESLSTYQKQYKENLIENATKELEKQKKVEKLEDSEISVIEKEATEKAALLSLLLSNLLILAARVTQNPDDELCNLALAEFYNANRKSDFPFLDPLELLLNSARNSTSKTRLYYTNQYDYAISQLEKTIFDPNNLSIFKTEAKAVYEEIKNTKPDSIETKKLLTDIARETNRFLLQGETKDAAHYRHLANCIAPKNKNLSRAMFIFGITVIALSVAALALSFGASSFVSALGISAGVAAIVAASTAAVATGGTVVSGYHLFKPTMKDKMEKLADHVEKSTCIVSV